MPITAIAYLQATGRGAAFVGLTLFCLVVSIELVRGQSGQPEPPPAASLAPQPPPAPAPAGPPPQSRPGLIDKLGDLLRDSAEGVASGLKGTQQRIEDINKGTLDTLTSIPVAGLASGRALCPRADNGAPDCYAATEKLCKDKGYTSGRSLDMETAETCNPRVYLPGYQRKDGDCRIESFVTRAACQ